ncbi:VOC family protein [Vibrio scophthalmi]|uniref:VOC family protein n=1 Tax=Vibrio scophthalmi TaxID=45658 RepID=UPI002FF11653
MYQITPYLFFAGRCAEALHFYRDSFEADVTSVQYFKDSPQVIEGAEPHWIMHAEIDIMGNKLMLSDGVVAKELSGNTIALSIVLDDLDLQARLFDKLATQGRVMMPLADTFWGARFGKVEDQFGIRWMLHCNLV